MNSVRRTVRLTAIPAAMALFLIATPFESAARAQTTLREAGKAAVAADDADEVDSQTPARSGLGWTGISLISAGGLLVAGSFTFNDSKSCGFFNELACRDVGRAYGISGVTMIATGLTFLVMDEVRRHPEPYSGKAAESASADTKQRRAGRPARQTAIAIGPRAIQIRMLF
jgi:hypothetical protein